MALNNLDSQIKEDHENAKILANGISEIEALSINVDKVKTNIIYFNLESNKINSNQLLEGMKKSGVLFFEVSPNQYRLVTHYGITKTDIDFTLSTFKKVLS